MSDDASPAPAKRGRKANSATADRAEKNDKLVESKKRAKKDSKDDDEGATAAKRGRGRPKGTTKKTKAAAKLNIKATGNRQSTIWYP
nr:unnamed protein product [Callosobruchus chinensis]